MKTSNTTTNKPLLNGMAKKILFIALGAAIYSFGIHNIHQRTAITEGGIIGLMLLIEHWFFIRDSLIATIAVSAFYKLWEMFPPMLPDLSAYPFAAAVCGALFVGVGVGLIIRQGGSGSGDDALALTISHVTHWRLSAAYLFTDLTVLTLSLTYIPVKRIFFSLITVTLSSFLIDQVQNFGRGGARQPEEPAAEKAGA